MMVKRRARVSPKKERALAELKELAKKYSVIGIADISSLPTAQIQQIKKRLRGSMEFKVAKKSLVIKVLEELGVERKRAEEVVKGTPLLIFTSLNPFKMYSMITKERIPIEAKPGQRVEKEVIVPAGETPITPGPMLGVLGRLKIPYEVKGGKVHVKKDTVVAKPGDTIGPELASILLKLGIKPFDIGIDLIAAYDGGVLLPRDSLKLDVEAFRRDIVEATSELIKLAIGIGYIEIPEALQQMIIIASREADVVASSTFIPLPGLIEPALARASLEVESLIAAMGERAKDLGLEPVAPAAAAQPAEAKPAEVKEEKKEEEKKEEEVDISSGLEGLFGF